MTKAFFSPIKLITRLSFSLVGISLLASCDLFSEDSDDFSKEDIYMLAELTAKGNSDTYIKINLHEKDGFGKPIELVNGDKLLVTFLGQSVQLSKDDNLIEIDYTASLPNQGQAGVYSVIFQRYDGSQVVSEVTMLAPYQIHSPREYSVFTEGDAVNINWSPIALEGDISVHGHLSCKTYEDDLSTEWDNENEDWQTSDNGDFQLPLNKLILNLTREITIEDENFDYTVPCVLDFDMSRTMQGDLSGQYAKGSTLQATQYRQVKNISVWLLPD